MKDSFKLRLLIYYMLISNLKELCVSDVQWFLIVNNNCEQQEPCVADCLMPPCLSSCSLGSSLQLLHCLEGFAFILKTFLNHLTAEKFRVQNLKNSLYDLIWQIISCAILQKQGRLNNIYVRARGLHVVWVVFYLQHRN